MKRLAAAMRRAPCPLLLAALASACGAPAPVADGPARDSAGPGSDRPAEPAAPATTTIPAAFHGTYDRSSAECSAPSVYRLNVSAEALRFHESIGTVRAVTVEAPDRIAIAADYQGEGESWSAEQRLRLSDGGHRLTVTGHGVETVRVRCGGAAAGAAPEWEGAASGEGDGLSLRSAGQRRLTLFCPAGSDDLLVNVPAFTPVGSEERMSLGSGGTVVALVADPAGDSARGGVSGRGPVPAELERILAGSGGVAVNYGYQNSGPHPAPPAELAAAFVRGCRD